MTSTVRSTRGQSTAAATGRPRGAGASRADGEVTKAVKRDLAEIRRSDKKLAESGLAASALALARELDNDDNSATSKSMCARALREALDRLRELAPAPKTNDAIDNLSGRAALKLAGPSAT